MGRAHRRVARTVNLFHVIDGGVVHLQSRGVYREAKVYRRGEHIFAKWGVGFIRLLGQSGTTLSSVSWSDIDADGVALKPSGRVPYYMEPSA